MKIPFGLKRVGVLIVLRHQDQMLLLKRAKPPHQGRFTPVGGKVDPHERPYDTAIRETIEETGIHLPHVKYAGLLTESSPTAYNWVVYVYMAKIDWQPAPPCDEGILEWITEAQIESLDTPETDRFIYQYVYDQKPFAFHASYDEEERLLELIDEMENKVVYTR